MIELLADHLRHHSTTIHLCKNTMLCILLRERPHPTIHSLVFVMHSFHKLLVFTLDSKKQMITMEVSIRLIVNLLTHEKPLRHSTHLLLMKLNSQGRNYRQAQQSTPETIYTFKNTRILVLTLLLQKPRRPMKDQREVTILPIKGLLYDNI